MKIHSKALVALFTTGQISKSREDKDMTEELTVQKSMEKDTAKVNKKLFPKEAYDPIDKLVGKARTYHRSVTFPSPFGDILAVALQPEWKAKMDGFQAEFNELVQSHWVERYDYWMSRAQNMHNGTFNPSWYPSVGELANEFNFKTATFPMPMGQHLAITGLLNDELEEMRKEIDATVKAAEKQSTQEAMRRVMKEVAHIAETLAKPKPKIYESLVGNLQNALKVSKALNIADDPQIDKMIAECEASLLVSTEALRDNKEYAAVISQKASQIMQNFGQAGKRKIA
jgi:hypothetical protein